MQESEYRLTDYFLEDLEQGKGTGRFRLVTDASLEPGIVCLKITEEAWSMEEARKFVKLCRRLRVTPASFLDKLETQ